MDRLTKRLFEDVTVRPPALRGLVFHVLRGLALSEAMLGALPFDTPHQSKNLPQQRRLAAEALTLLLDTESVTVTARGAALRSWPGFAVGKKYSKCYNCKLKRVILRRGRPCLEYSMVYECSIFRRASPDR